VYFKIANGILWGFYSIFKAAKAVARVMKVPKQSKPSSACWFVNWTSQE